MRIAHEFKLDPWAILHTWTERQYQTVLAWLDGEWNHPNRSDYYAMLVARRISVLGGASQSDTVEREKIRFSDMRAERRKAKQIKKMSLKEKAQAESTMAAEVKAKWLGFAGMKTPTK